MDIARRIVTFNAPVHAARGDDGNFGFEWHKSFKDKARAAKFGEGLGGFGGGCIPQHRLPLAVIAESPRLQHAGAAECGERRRQVWQRIHGAERRGFNADAVEECFLNHPVLRRLKRVWLGKDGDYRLR